MNFTHEQNTLLSLIKTSLCFHKNREAFLEIPEDLDWNSFVNLAARQGVLCVARDGLTQIGGLSRELLIRWELSIQKLEARNKRQRAVIKELVALFRENGIEMLLLKGIGLSELYPDPNHRECGDIDIFLLGDYEKGNKVIEDLEIEVDKKGTKHSNFFFKGVPVENHKTFLNVEYTKADKNLEKHLHKILCEQGFDTITIDDITVRIPTPDFTAIFLSRHNIIHFLASGLVLRHFCDLALFFEKNRARIDFANFEKAMREYGQYNLICSFLEIGQMHLGLPEESLPEFSIDRYQVTTLANRVLEDTFYNKFRPVDKKEIETMWVPCRKLLGVKQLFRSKWKYDSIENGLFFKSLIFRIHQNFQLLNWK
ncbi:MAG: nucleotidyltransferase family protein [Bacteroidales bacterium]|nr:nucleotidyltransferase family protein [Bacteroidales bacterium]